MNPMKKFFTIALTSTVSLSPLVAFASASTIQDVLRNLTLPIQLATTLIVALSLLAFFWGMAMYVFGSSNDDKRKKGIPMMVWGIVALFVMLSIFGIINMLQATFLVGGGTIQVPKISN